MFDNLTDKLQDTFRRLRGQAKLSENNISDALREIRTALLEADVNLNVVKEFVETVKTDCIGAGVIKSVTPGQQVVKIVHDRLVELMGDEQVDLDLRSHPSVIMMVGLHGSGKTTTSGKLALRLKKERQRVMLVAGDIYRPAAIDQLEVIGREIEVPVFADRSCSDVALIARNAIEKAKLEHCDVVIIDTAGRLQIDESMVQELVRVSQSARADEILLVADAALGQEAVSVSEHFHKALGLTGIVLTKLDGDSRGGAALSMRKVTGCPIKFIGSGEKLENIEAFYPDRMASRILGMGDVVSLVERAAEKIDEEAAAKLQEKLRKNKFDFNDFLSQLRQIGNLGGAEAVLKMLPGGKQLAGALNSFDPRHFSRMEAIICSMTTKERENPDLIDFSRRKRIAKGSGTSLEAVSQLIKQFDGMRKMMKKSGILGRLFSGNNNDTEMNAESLMNTISGNGYTGTGLSRDEKERRRKLEKQKKKQRQKQRRKK
ncbi:MAG: signal recognition particle protein [Victivallaceae bacterium]|jgi:signal recognition particle subunit SRP54|nr:signal recognition particle protein [Victivallaceae bacterium]NLK84099.1 signal recognition particle protein [Lentisphaerota bacterium]MDD3117017.1 signal recognition particle protein [Victivallaceae bacterium]MDD3702907.1 signal recognition particle protein [Victivallaceae bacterium]MDD4317624.1 signal recognition particle protein [Victivallaceae bacterium]